MKAPLGLTFCDPNQVLHALPVSLGDQVADFGAGSGFFSIAFAQAVGPEGRVYALDVLPSALEAITSRAKALSLPNVIVNRVNLEQPNGSGLGAETVDWVIIKDVLVQNEKKDVILNEAKRVLKPRGAVLVIEWDVKETSVGPDPHHRLAPDVLRSLLEKTGFIIEQTPDVGCYHYAFVGKKTA